MRLVPTCYSILEDRNRSLQYPQTFSSKFGIGLPDSQERADCPSVKGLRHQTGTIRYEGGTGQLTLNDIVHHDQKMLAFVFDPTL